MTMLPIVKGNPPKEFVRELRELRSTPGASASWDQVRTRGAVIEALCREQGQLCAYCMKRISPNTAHVEHVVPQSKCAPSQDVDYDNMLAVCDGNEGAGSRGVLTCDRARGDVPLKVNPLRPETLAEIRYRSDGIICSDDAGVQRDLDETLNLNCREAYLPQNRKKVIDTLNLQLRKVAESGNVVGYCMRQRDAIARSEVKLEFAGVMLYFLEKRIRRG